MTSSCLIPPPKGGRLVFGTVPLHLTTPGLAFHIPNLYPSGAPIREFSGIAFLASADEPSCANHLQSFRPTTYWRKSFYMATPLMPQPNTILPIVIQEI